MAKGTSVGAKRTPGVTPNTSPQSTALDAPSSLTPRPKEDAETARMKEELQSLRNLHLFEFSVVVARVVRVSQRRCLIARAKAEDNKMNSSVLSSSGGNLQVPGVGVVSADGSMNSNGPPLSPATLSLVAEAEAFVLSDARPDRPARPPNEYSAGTDNSSFGLDGSPFMFKPRPSSTPPYVPLSNEGAQDPDPEDDASPRDPNTHQSPAMHQRPAAGGTRSGGAVMSPVCASSPKAGLSLTVQGISPSSQQAANNGSSAYTGGGMYSASPYNNNTYPTGVTAVTAESAAKAVALAAAKAHRVGTPFNADVGLRVGGSGIAATASSQAGLYATDNRVVQLGGVDSLQQYRPHNKGPVLQPLRRPGAQPVPIGVARAVTPPREVRMPQGQSLMPPRQQHDGQQHMMMADGARPRTVAIPAGMSAPQENNGVPKDGKLYFALNAQDVQRQLQQDADDRKRLEEHQNRIQEQLLHLRQLQHENEALMGRATPSSGMRAKMSGGRVQPQFFFYAQDVQRQLQQDADDRKRLEEHQNRIQEQLLHLRQLQHENEALMGRATPSSGMRAKMSGGRVQGPQGNHGAGIPMGITRLATPNNSVGSAAVISPNKSGPVAPTMVVNSSAPPSGMQLHHALESAAAITVPTQEGKKSQLVANIVAQHRR
ncbi:Hypothetical protein, putative [Bodo saltans]|uniref:Uncharacterized protein n=1 Tax=Bodo saltans TaxID=75058 RepID=A0A0S4IR15_BODSA|nr:Hypothetical protein, putative [Bodo saltans]|eukprot:CUE66191.1 Hypothetical protein, putative [Bodo saltans]